MLKRSVSVFLDIAKIVNFWKKNVDVRRTPWMCQVIYIFFGSSIGKM